MKLKIVSKGDAANTYVIDASTGEAVENVRRVAWELDAITRQPRCTIEVLAVPVDLVAESEVITATTDPDLEEALNPKGEEALNPKGEEAP